MLRLRREGGIRPPVESQAVSKTDSKCEVFDELPSRNVSSETKSPPRGRFCGAVGFRAPVVEAVILGTAATALAPAVQAAEVDATAAPDTKASSEVTRVELSPIGADKGERVYFLFGMRYNLKGKGLGHDLFPELKPTVTDDIQRARESGYTVIVDDHAAKSDLLEALYDPSAKAVVWMGHGSGMSTIMSADREIIWPTDIEADKVGDKLSLVVIESCEAGKDSTWKERLGKAELKAWDEEIYLFSLKDFNKPNGKLKDLLFNNPEELDDLLGRHLGR